jgi:anti-sigma regulatory factor (Ser/Thr protein kinase)
MSERRQFPAQPTALRDIRRFVHEAITQRAFGAADADEVTLAVSEASTDAIFTGHRDQLEVRLQIHEKDIVVEVAETGASRGDQPVGERPMGHGLPMIRQMVDEVTIAPGTGSRSGTTVRMVWRRESRA